jgi:phage shock protein PspC (stress-responsive transcriptional regulator)
METTSAPAPEQKPATVAERRLYRSNRDSVVAGISGGLGEYFAIDPVWFRIGFVVLAFGGGSGFLIYLLMWLVIPKAPDGYIPPSADRGKLTGAAVVGVVFMIVGTIALINTISPSLGQYVWPMIFLLGGLALILGGLNRDSHR